MTKCKEGCLEWNKDIYACSYYPSMKGVEQPMETCTRARPRRPQLDLFKFVGGG